VWLRNGYTAYCQSRFMAKAGSKESDEFNLDNLERIPRREPPHFDEQPEDIGLISGMTSSGGIFKVAFHDSNQFGPHAMIVMLFGFATITGAVLFGLSLL